MEIFFLLFPFSIFLFVCLNNCNEGLPLLLFALLTWVIDWLIDWFVAAYINIKSGKIPEIIVVDNDDYDEMKEVKEEGIYTSYDLMYTNIYNHSYSEYINLSLSSIIIIVVIITSLFFLYACVKHNWIHHLTIIVEFRYKNLTMIYDIYDHIKVFATINQKIETKTSI